MARVTLRDTLAVDFERYTESALRHSIQLLKSSQRGDFLPAPLALTLRAMEKVLADKQKSKPVTGKPDIRSMIQNLQENRDEDQRRTDC